MFTTATIAKYAYVYMAKPLSARNVPAFCLSCFGTDNKFTTEQIVLRWKYIIDECQQREIKVLTFSSDGDTRLLSGMQMCTGLNLKYSNVLECESHAIPKSVHLQVPQQWHSWWLLKRPISDVAFVQDTVHIAVKLKCRLLKPSVVLPMGSFTAGAHHLRILQIAAGKDSHGLRERDLDHKDKQNFDAVTHMIKAAPLLETIPDSIGTKTYIDLIECVTDSYISKQFSAIERVEKIWFATFFLRYWRMWIKLHSSYNLTDNFVTPNAYVCIELNAHSLVQIIRTIRDKLKEPECFVPNNFSSQSCEGLFRSARSMSSVFSTFINFSMLGLLRRIHRLHIQALIQAESSRIDIIFPQIKRHQAKDGDCCMNSLPQSVCKVSDSDIAGAVQRAKTMARERIEKLGMSHLLNDHNLWDNQADVINDTEIVLEDEQVEENNLFQEEKPESSSIPEFCLDSDYSHVNEDIENLSQKNLISSDFKDKLHKSLHKISKCNTISTYRPVETPDICPPSKKIAVHSRKPFVEVHPNVFIRKTTALWLFQEGERVSSDRLFRVRTNQPFSSNTCTTALNPHVSSSQLPTTSDVVHVGDACAFKVGEQKQYFNIGKVLQFSQLNTENRNFQQCKQLTVKISPNLGVLCAWFEMQKNSTRMFKLLCNPAIAHKYVPITNYVCTLNFDCIIETASTIQQAPSSVIQSNPKQPILSMASEFLLTENCVDFVKKCLESSSVSTSSADTGSKLQDSLQIESKEGCKNETQYTLDKQFESVVSDSTDSSQYESIVWKKIDNFHLYKEDKRVLLSHDWLNDNHMNCAQHMLKKQFPRLHGLQCTVLQSYTPQPLSQNSLQILHVSGNHWIALSTLDNGTTDSTPTIYDSRYQGVSIDTQTILAKFLPQGINNSEQQFSIAIANVAQQSGSSDCGLFAIAYLTHLSHGLNPVYYNFKQDKMREHFLKCIERETMTPFPTVSQRTARLVAIKESVIISLYCYCRMPDDGSKMVKCQSSGKRACKLGGWCHLKCIDAGDVKKNRKWICNDCKKEEFL